MRINEHVFREKSDGTLELVGDFEELYRSCSDPWEQSGGGNDAMAAYYKHSRHRLATVLKRVMATRAGPVLEVGCGHGHVVDYLSRELPYATVEGIDVSASAIEGARKRYPMRRFQRQDIRVDWTPHGNHRVIILNQVLWYILDGLKQSLTCCYNHTEDSGYLVVSQGFPKERQRYAPSVDFNGFLSIMLEHGRWQLVGAEYDASSSYKNHDGILVFLRK